MSIRIPGIRALTVAGLALHGSACVYISPVSVDQAGTVAGAEDIPAAVSGDGRYTVFTTLAALVPGDTNGLPDVYLRDEQLGTTELVSATPGSAAGDGASGHPSISADGATVAFVSTASDLGPAGNGLQQVYYRDIAAGTTYLASAAGGVPGDAASGQPSISADGRAIAFASLADNLDALDDNGVSDIYLFEVPGQTLTYVSTAPGPLPGDGPSTEPSINGDGSAISFTSAAANLVPADTNAVDDVFLYRESLGIVRVSEGILGEGDGPSGQSSLAAQIDRVAFVSSAGNLVAGDANGVADVFVREPGGALRRVTEKAGFGFLHAAGAPRISADGSRVVLLADGRDLGHEAGPVAAAVDLASGDFSALSTAQIDKPAVPASHPVLSHDGRYAGFLTQEGLAVGDTNGLADVYLRFAYRAMVWPWSLTPGRVQPGTVVPVTLAGFDFPVNGPAPVITVMGRPEIIFSAVTTVDSRTITATMNVPAAVPQETYQVLLEYPEGGPGDGSGLARNRHLLTVAAADPPADLVDIGAAVGFPGADGFSYGLHRADIDGDGIDDVVFVTHSPHEEALYLGTGSGVIPVPVMYAADRHHCDSADVNLDGRLDLYCSVGADKGTGVGDNGLFLQQPNGDFVDAASEWGVTDPYGRGREVTFLHADNDGLPDLYVSNHGPRDDEFVSENQLFLNQGGTAFTPAPGFGVSGDLSSFCARTVDIDGDGDDDLVVCVDTGLRVFINQAGAGFVDQSAALGLDEFFRDVDFADVDGDGDVDLLGATPGRFLIYRLENGANVETLYSAVADHPEAVAFGDLDGDGDPDAFLVQRGCRSKSEGNLPDLALRNDGGAFTPLGTPAMERGCGDTVIAFDHDQDGADGFLVGNGRGRRGPLQYLVLP